MAENAKVLEEIYGEGQEESLEVASGPKVQTLEDATNFAYGLDKTREEIKSLREIAEKEKAKWQEKIDQVDSWLVDVTAPLLSKEEYLSAELLAYHQREYNAADDKSKKKLTSIKLPYGITLKSRAQQDKLEVADEKAYLAYAKANKLVKVAEPTVKWKEMKADLVINDDGRVLAKSTGEFLDFIKVVPQDRTFEVK